MAELADAPDLGSGAARHAGSTPVTRTTASQALYRLRRFFMLKKHLALTPLLRLFKTQQAAFWGAALPRVWVANAAQIKSRRSKAECLLFHYHFVAPPSPTRRVPCGDPSGDFAASHSRRCSAFSPQSCALRGPLSATSPIGRGKGLAMQNRATING